MAKNKISKFGISEGLTYETQEREELKEPATQKAIKKPKNSPKKKTRVNAYKFSLHLDEELGDYVAFVRYKYDKTVTQFINELVKAAMDNDENYTKD